MINSYFSWQGLLAVLLLHSFCLSLALAQTNPEYYDSADMQESAADEAYLDNEPLESYVSDSELNTSLEASLLGIIVEENPEPKSPCRCPVYDDGAWNEFRQQHGVLEGVTHHCKTVRKMSVCGALNPIGPECPLEPTDYKDCPGIGPCAQRSRVGISGCGFLIKESDTPPGFEITGCRRNTIKSFACTPTPIMGGPVHNGKCYDPLSAEQQQTYDQANSEDRKKLLEEICTFRSCYSLDATGREAAASCVPNFKMDVPVEPVPEMK